MRATPNRSVDGLVRGPLVEPAEEREGDWGLFVREGGDWSGLEAVLVSEVLGSLG